MFEYLQVCMHTLPPLYQLWNMSAYKHTLAKHLHTAISCKHVLAKYLHMGVNINQQNIYTRQYPVNMHQQKQNCMIQYQLWSMIAYKHNTSEEKKLHISTSALECVNMKKNLLKATNINSHTNMWLVPQHPMGRSSQLSYYIYTCANHKCVISRLGAFLEHHCLFVFIPYDEGFPLHLRISHPYLYKHWAPCTILQHGKSRVAGYSILHISEANHIHTNISASQKLSSNACNCYMCQLKAVVCAYLESGVAMCYVQVHQVQKLTHPIPLLNIP